MVLLFCLNDVTLDFVCDAAPFLAYVEKIGEPGNETTFSPSGKVVIFNSLSMVTILFLLSLTSRVSVVEVVSETGVTETETPVVQG